MQVNDLVRFNRENYYNGAVQTEWFYDVEKVAKIADSYVFHGPKYYGVSSKDVLSREHKLIDTVTFTDRLATKLYEEKLDNSFMLTIAGYGTGKSHLAVTLGALFSGNQTLSNIVIENIVNIDSLTGDLVKSKIHKKNLIIALNGMKNFNLDSEVLRCARISLAQNGLDDSVLKLLTKSYDIARHFISHNFDMHKSSFEGAAKKHGLSSCGAVLKEYIINSLEEDSKVIDIINDVYQEITGTSLHWEQGLSAGDILLTLSKELCGEGKPFNKILVLFDEFGRYIEYVAANPTIAGDASLQQIFEATQNAFGKVIFVGFIQYELEAYLSHIDKTANVIRYVGRYNQSEKYYLSSNFETILANLLEKKDEKLFERVVRSALSKYDYFHSKMHSALSRWSGSRLVKNVWTSETLYKNVIMEGCYPLHPVTVLILSSTDAWMQQRSAIAFCGEMFDEIIHIEIDGTWLPYIYPIDIIDSGIYEEMLGAEEKGLVKSQNCMLYNEINIKIGDKLTKGELQVLKAILITKIAKFSFYDKDDVVVAIRYCTNMKDEHIKSAIKNLEDRHGVIAFDNQSMTFDLIAEANGFNEFNRVFGRYRTGIKAEIEDMDEEILAELHLNDSIDTAYAMDNHISSQEWKFEKRLLDSETIDKDYLNLVLRYCDSANTGEVLRGVLIYAYCLNNSTSDITRISGLCEELEIENTPVIILFLDDTDGEIITALTVISTLIRFSSADAERFSKHITAQKRSYKKKIIHTFNNLVMERKMITSTGLVSYVGRLNMLCTECFKRVYKTPVPFVFDGFENSNATQAKKTFATICIKLFDRTLMNIQSYQALNVKDKNRVQACLAVGTSYSWQVFNDLCQLVLPQNDIIKKIYADVDASISYEESFSVNRLFGMYLHAPYGMNIYSYSLFVIYFIQKHENELICLLGNEKLTTDLLSNSIFKDGKLKFSELQKVTIQKNINADINVVAQICNEILDNTYVENCSQLRKKLNDILHVEGEANQNQVILAQAILRLDDGDRIRNKLNDKIDRMNKILEEAQTTMLILKFISVFEYLDKVYGVIEEGLPYIYSQQYIDNVSTVQKRIKNMLDEPFERSLRILKCSDITKLSSFKNAYRKVAHVLRNNGYDSQASNVEFRMQNIIEEVNARNKYKTALGDCEKDVALLSNVSQLGYKECKERVTKLEGWKAFFDNADMPKTMSAPLLEKVCLIIRDTESRKCEILKKIDSIEEDVDASTTLDDLMDIYKRISELLEEDFPENVEARLVEINKKINDLEDQIDKLPGNIDQLETAILESNEAENSYIRIYINEITELCKHYKTEQENWINRFIIPVESESEMDAQECSFWIERMRVYPEYLSEATVERAKKAEEIVTTNLRKRKVQGVFSMYNRLSDEEKEAFWLLVRNQV